jgi:hypothetical protein
MKKLLMLVVAAMALAIPASASAHDGLDFTHEGQFVEETTEVTLAGPVGFTGAATVQCANSHVILDLFPNGTGEITKFDCIGGLLNATFIVDDTAINPHNWDVEVIGHNHIEISGVKIHNTYTHPTLGVCVAESFAEGTVTAKFLGNPENSSEAELYTDTNGEFTSGGAGVALNGRLDIFNTSASTTGIGIATT